MKPLLETFKYDLKSNTPVFKLIYMNKEKERSLGIHASVIVESEAQTGNISIKADREQVSPKQNLESESRPSVHASVIVGHKGQTGDIRIRKTTKIKYIALGIGGLLASLCASAIWDLLRPVWDYIKRIIMG